MPGVASAKTLKEILRIRDETPFFNAVENLSDYATVLVAASYLSTVLEDLILTRMRKGMGKDWRDKLFEDPGPVSGFSSRIRIGYALELFGAGARGDLDCVREIRNAFAHSTHSILLTTPAVAKECANVRPVERFGGKQKDIINAFKTSDRPERDVFVWSVGLLYQALHLRKWPIKDQSTIFDKVLS